MSNIFGGGKSPAPSANKAGADNRLNEIIRVKVEELFGDRGNPDNHAVRQKDLEGLNNALGGLLKTTGNLASSIKGTSAGLGTLGDKLSALGTIISNLQTDVSDLQSQLATDETTLSDLQSKVDAAAAVSVPSMGASHAAANPPTKAEFDALVDDVSAIHAALSAIVAAL